ncbi:MAG: hypothetical protein ACLFSI_08325 [Halorhodospira sp.]
MNEDYPAAARRHWRDAALLDENRRWENADHHYGFAAECAVKSALQFMGYLREEHRSWHINVLWNKVQHTAYQRRFPQLARELSKDNCFEKWSVQQRYHCDGVVGEQEVRSHRYCAHKLLIAIGLFRG